MTQQLTELLTLCKKFGVKSCEVDQKYHLTAFEFFPSPEIHAPLDLPANTKIPTEDEFLYMATEYDPNENKDKPAIPEDQL